MSQVTVATNYIAGVCVAMLSSLCSAIGLTLQKRVHKMLAARHALEAATAEVPAPATPGPITGEKSADATPVATPTTPAVAPKKRDVYWRQPLWLLGIVLMLVGAIMSFATFALMGQSRASAMAAITIVWNSMLARSCLNEIFTWVDAVTTILIVLGATIAVIFGASGASTLSTTTLDDIDDTLERPLVGYAALVLFVVFVVSFLFIRYSHKLKERRSEGMKRAECMVRVALAGLFSGSTGMLARDVVVCLVWMVSNKSAIYLERYDFYLLLLALPFSLVLQLSYLNSALRQLDNLEVVPPYQCSIILVGIVWGYLFSSEFDDTATTSLGLFIGGALISCLGVAILFLKKRLLRNMVELRRRLRVLGVSLDLRSASSAPAVLSLISEPGARATAGSTTSEKADVGTPLLRSEAGGHKKTYSLTTNGYGGGHDAPLVASVELTVMTSAQERAAAEGAASDWHAPLHTRSASAYSLRPQSLGRPSPSPLRGEGARAAPVAADELRLNVRPHLDIMVDAGTSPWAAEGDSAPDAEGVPAGTSTGGPRPFVPGSSSSRNGLSTPYSPLPHSALERVSEEGRSGSISSDTSGAPEEGLARKGSLRRMLSSRLRLPGLAAQSSIPAPDTTLLVPLEGDGGAAPPSGTGIGSSGSQRSFPPPRARVPLNRAQSMTPFIAPRPGSIAAHAPRSSANAAVPIARSLSTTRPRGFTLDDVLRATAHIAEAISMQGSALAADTEVDDDGLGDAGEGAAEEELLEEGGGNATARSAYSAPRPPGGATPYSSAEEGDEAAGGANGGVTAPRDA